MAILLASVAFLGAQDDTTIYTKITRVAFAIFIELLTDTGKNFVCHRRQCYVTKEIVSDDRSTMKLYISAIVLVSFALITNSLITKNQVFSE